MGKRREQQQPLFIATKDVVSGPGNAFYDRLNQILLEHKFDRKVEALCRRFYKSDKRGRPSMAPGVYFRLLLIGYFEGLDSERGIAWRVADSLSLRKFLDFALDDDSRAHLDHHQASDHRSCPRNPDQADRTARRTDTVHHQRSRGPERRLR